VAKDKVSKLFTLIVYFDGSLIEARPQGIKKEPAQLSSCKSAHQQKQTISKAANTEPMHTILSLNSKTPGKEACHSSPSILQR
jgi:hypothetical protein